MNKANNERGTNNLIEANTKLFDENKWLKADNERLNNIINELEKRLEEAIEDNKKEYNLKSQMAVFVLRDTLELIEELKGVDKECV